MHPSWASHSGGDTLLSPAILPRLPLLLLSHSFYLDCLTTLALESFRFLPGGSNLVWTTGGFKLMNSFYWTWIYLRIEISQHLLSDDPSLPEDVLGIKKKKKTQTKETKMCTASAEKTGEEGGPVLCEAGSWGSYTPSYENISAYWILEHSGEFSHCLVAEFKMFLRLAVILPALNLLSSYRCCQSTPSLSINYPYYLASSKLKPLTPDLPQRE